MGKKIRHKKRLLILLFITMSLITLVLLRNFIAAKIIVRILDNISDSKLNSTLFVHNTNVNLFSSVELNNIVIIPKDKDSNSGVSATINNVRVDYSLFGYLFKSSKLINSIAISDADIKIYQNTITNLIKSPSGKQKNQDRKQKENPISILKSKFPEVKIQNSSFVIINNDNYAKFLNVSASFTENAAINSYQGNLIMNRFELSQANNRYVFDRLNFDWQLNSNPNLVLTGTIASNIIKKVTLILTPPEKPDSLFEIESSLHLVRGDIYISGRMKDNSQNKFELSVLYNDIDLPSTLAFLGLNLSCNNGSIDGKILLTTADLTLAKTAIQNVTAIQNPTIFKNQFKQILANFDLKNEIINFNFIRIEYKNSTVNISGNYNLINNNIDIMLKSDININEIPSAFIENNKVDGDIELTTKIKGTIGNLYCSSSAIISNLIINKNQIPDINAKLSFMNNKLIIENISSVDSNFNLSLYGSASLNFTKYSGYSALIDSLSDIDFTLNSSVKSINTLLKSLTMKQLPVDASSVANIALKGDNINNFNFTVNADVNKISLPILYDFSSNIVLKGDQDEISGELRILSNPNTEILLAKLNISSFNIAFNSLEQIKSMPIQLKVKLKNIINNPNKPFIKQLAGIQASVNGEIDIQNSINKPIAEFNLKASKLSFYGQRLPDLDIVIKYLNGRLELSPIKYNSEFGSLDAIASLQLNTADLTEIDKNDINLNAMISIENKNWEIFNSFLPTIIKNINGELKSSAIISGTLTKPNINGKISIMNAELSFNKFIPALRAIKFKADFSDELIQIKQCTFTAGEETLYIIGNMAFKDVKDLKTNKVIKCSDLKLLIKGDNVLALSDENMRMRISPELEITGNLICKQLNIAGNINIDKFDYHKFMSLGGSSGKSQFKLPSIENMDWVNIDLNIFSDDTIFVNNNLILMKSGLDFYLTGNLDSPELEGFFSAPKAILKMPNTTFITDNFEVIFNQDVGKEGTNINLNILAETNIGLTQVFVKVSGSVDQPSIMLYSDPYYPHDDLLSLVAFGTTQSSENVKNSTNIASSHIVRWLKNKVANEESLANAGEGFWERLRIETDFKAGVADPIIRAEYGFSSRFSLYGEKDEYGDYNFDVQYKTRFK